ncbi:helix-turn-helix domain-containing protein [Paremcibacter congregatus]|nr:helix-turn-helix domain-containing protein [Paremcibacter congregatus]
MRYDDEFRLIVTRYFLKTGDVRYTSKKYNIPVSTIYKWYEKYRKGGENGLRKKSTRPNTSPNKTCDELERLVVGAWLEIKTRRNYVNVKKKLDDRNIKLSLPTIKKILNRKNHMS